MTQSIWGYEAAPHPTDVDQEWTIEVAPESGESGNFALTVTLPAARHNESVPAQATAGAVDHDATAGAVQSAIRALDGTNGVGDLSGVSTAGGPLGTAPVTVTFPASSYALSVTPHFSKTNTKINLTLTAGSAKHPDNITVLNPTGAQQSGKTAYRKSYTPKFGADTYTQPDGTPIASGGGL